MFGQCSDPAWLCWIECQAVRWTHEKPGAPEGQWILLSNERFEACERDNNGTEFEDWSLRSDFLQAPAILEPEHYVSVVELG
jgi:hypothetical protein